MTTPTGAPDTATPLAAAAATTRRPRRAPADLPFDFADATLAEALATERTEPDWLRADRLAAAASFAALPVESSELYTSYVDLRSADLFGAVPSVATSTIAAGAGDVPEGSAGVIDFVDGEPVSAALAPEIAAQGVILESLGAAIARGDAGVRASLETTALPADEKLAQLSRGFWSQGIHLHVPDGVRIEAPFVLRHALGASGATLLTRTLIRLGDDAEASIVEELVAADGAPEAAAQSLFGSTSEIEMGAHAVLRFASIQDLPDHAVAFQQRAARIGDGATLRFAIAHLGGRMVRSRIDNRLEGKGAEVEQIEIVFGGNEQLFDLTAYTRHIGQDTTGNLLSKAVLQQGARAYIKGLISIEKTARGTDSYLGEFGMILDKKSRSVTIPSLEIDQPDCRRAAHASSVGPIDPNQLFYLESRGITPDEARKFITLGFLEPVVARVPLEAERERLWGLLEAKWNEHRDANSAAAGGAAVEPQGAGALA